jgi:hypothetical protein
MADISLSLLILTPWFNPALPGVSGSRLLVSVLPHHEVRMYVVSLYRQRTRTVTIRSDRNAIMVFMGFRGYKKAFLCFYVLRLRQLAPSPPLSAIKDVTF